MSSQQEVNSVIAKEDAPVATESPDATESPSATEPPIATSTPVSPAGAAAPETSATRYPTSFVDSDSASESEFKDELGFPNPIFPDRNMSVSPKPKRPDTPVLNRRLSFDTEVDNTSPPRFESLGSGEKGKKAKPATRGGLSRTRSTQMKRGGLRLLPKSASSATLAGSSTAATSASADTTESAKKTAKKLAEKKASPKGQ